MDWVKNYKSKTKYDLIFIDPPFNKNLIDDLLSCILNKNLLSNHTRIKTFKIPIHKNINVSGETLVEVSHAVRYIDSVGAVLKLQGILDVGILVNKSNEKI